MRRSVQRPGLLALALCLAPLAAGGEDMYPTIPDDQDYMCETIGRSAGGLVSAPDRAWFQKTCTCSPEKVCGRAGSKRYAARLKAVPSDVQVQKQADARVRAWRASALQATERLRQDYRYCRDNAKNCENQMVALEEGCKLVGLLTWDECLGRE
jgi:hypothetical protein